MVASSVVASFSGTLSPVVALSLNVSSLGYKRAISLVVLANAGLTPLRPPGVSCLSVNVCTLLLASPPLLILGMGSAPHCSQGLISEDQRMRAWQAV